MSKKRKLSKIILGMTVCLSMAGVILPLQTTKANCWQEVMPYMEELAPTKYETTVPPAVEMMRCINNRPYNMRMNTNNNQFNIPYIFNNTPAWKVSNCHSQLPTECNMCGNNCLYPQEKNRFNQQDNMPHRFLTYENQIFRNNLPFLDCCWND